METWKFHVFHVLTQIIGLQLYGSSKIGNNMDFYILVAQKKEKSY